MLLGFILSTAFHFLDRGGFYTDLFRYFSAGMLFYLFRKQIKINGWLAILSFIILGLSVKMGYFDYSFSIFGTYLIFYIAYETRLKLHNFGKYGDFSYGIYIYGFPLQQMISNIFNNQLTHWENFLLSFPFTLIFAIISWYLIEKRALKYKKYSLKSLILHRDKGNTTSFYR